MPNIRTTKQKDFKNKKCQINGTVEKWKELKSLRMSQLPLSQEEWVLKNTSNAEKGLPLTGPTTVISTHTLWRSSLAPPLPWELIQTTSQLIHPHTMVGPAVLMSTRTCRLNIKQCTLCEGMPRTSMVESLATSNQTSALGL